jgi:hypothetical protein
MPNLLQTVAEGVCGQGGMAVSSHLTVRVVDENAPLGETVARGRFLRRALVAGGTVVLGGVAIGGLPRVAVSAPSPEQDARILNFALLLEYLEAAFYGDAERRGLLRGELGEFARVVGDHERSHVAFLKGALGRAARKPPTFDFGRATSDSQLFSTAAAALEDMMVAAYNGQATNLTTKAFTAAATIVSVEARHAAWIRDIIGKTAAPDATDTPLTEAEVRAAMAKTGFVRAGG